MKIIIGKTGTGKTKAMIEESAKTWAYIVCLSLGRANDIQKFAKELGLDIPLPITHGEFIDRKYSSKGIRGFLIDDVEMLLQRISMVNVMAISMTDRENIQQLKEREFIESFDNLITNGMEEFHGLKDFKADFGFHEPIRTKTECSNPEFHDHKLHRVAIMKDEHFGSKGDRDEGGIAGWTSKLVCVGCGKEFQGQNGFYLDKKEQVGNV